MGFNPGMAAESAATFAGILAAIVLAVLGQLAVTVRERSRGHQYQLSLVVGFPLLVLLLACAYTFVLLSGQQPSLGQSAPEQLGTLRGAAFGFAICGSMLAVSAAGSLVFLRLVLQESGRATSVAATGARAAVIAGVFLDAVFLTYGYGDIHAAFYGEPFSFGQWVGHATLIGVPATIGLLWPPARFPRDELDGAEHRRLVSRLCVGMVLFSTLLPVWTFLVADKHSFVGWTTADGASVVWITYTAGAWAGLLLGVLLWLASAQDLGDEQPLSSFRARILGMLRQPTPRQRAEIDSACRMARRQLYGELLAVRREGARIRAQFSGENGLSDNAQRRWIKTVLREASLGYSPDEPETPSPDGRSPQT